MKQQKLIKPREYKIKTVDDFRQIPEDKIDKSLKEFGTALRVRKNMETTMNILGKSISGKDKVLDLTIPEFTWIDDKEKKLTVNIRNNRRAKTVKPK